MNVFLSILIGGALGAALGYYGKCTSGTCPLTATPWRGMVYGAVLGLIFHSVYGGAGAGSAGESTANVKLISQDQFAAEVTQAGTPVVVDFFATWCGPCKRLSPMLDELAEPLQGRVKFVKVDVDKSPELARQFTIQGVPSLVFFKEGKELDRVVGLPSREMLKNNLERLAGGEKDPAAKPL
jgi:thioredoxin 1